MRFIKALTLKTTPCVLTFHKFLIISPHICILKVSFKGFYWLSFNKPTKVPPDGVFQLIPTWSLPGLGSNGVHHFDKASKKTERIIL